MKIGKLILLKNGMKLLMMQEMIIKMHITVASAKMMKLRVWVRLLSRVLKQVSPRAV
jgi:hypothetical protein